MKHILCLLFFLSLTTVDLVAATHNIKEYGATGDGKHIDSPAINAAIEAAKAYDKYIIDNNLEHTLNGVIL